MANYERDKDDVRVYDGSEDDEDGEGSHLPVVIIIAILVLAAFGGVVWLAYNQGVARGRNEPVRIASTDGANAGSGIKVYQQPAGAEDEEEPPSPAKTQTEPPPPALPAAQTEAAPPAAMAQASPPPALTPAKPQAQPAPVATKPPAQLGLARPAPATPPSAAPKTTAAPAAAKPVAAAKPPVAAAPKPAVTTPAVTKPAAVAGGTYLLQIGAYKSEAEANTAWRIYQGKHATLLAGFGPDVQRADLGDKGVWYRLRISSFSNKDTAVALCERLKAQNGACFLAR